MSCEDTASMWTRIQRYASREVDVDSCFCTSVLLMYCLVAGYIGAVVFAACWIWVPFQTGNTIQLGIALAQQFAQGSDKSPHTFHVSDRQALTSLLCFFLGGLLNHLIPCRFNRKTRGYLALCTLFQTLLTAAACLTSHYGGEPTFAYSRGAPSWTTSFGFASIALLSMSFGLQGVNSDQLGSNFGVSVVLTSLWVQITYQPLTLWKPLKKRDHKIMAVLGMFVGAIVGRTIVGELNDTSAIAIAVGLRSVAAIGWLCTPSRLSPRRIDSEGTLIEDTLTDRLHNKVSAPKLSLPGQKSIQMYTQHSRDSLRTLHD